MLPMPWSVFPISKVDKLKMPRRCQPVNLAVPNVSRSSSLSSREVKEMSLYDDNGYKIHYKIIFSLKQEEIMRGLFPNSGIIP